MPDNPAPAAGRPHVGLFVTCLVDLYRPNIGFAAIKLLQQAGCVVDVPREQTCCGQPAMNSGDYKNAADIAKQVITAFTGYEYVVGPSGSCLGTIKTHYTELFTNDREWQQKAQDLAARSYELISFLTDVMGVKSVDSDYAGTVTYHDSCSGLRELGIKQQPRQLLNSIDGITIAEMENSEVCCGFGGTFCVKYPDISTRMASDKVASIETSDAGTVLGGDLGCLLNISGRLKRLGKPVRVYHAAEVLADMTDLPAIGDGDDAG